MVHDGLCTSKILLKCDCNSEPYFMDFLGTQSVKLGDKHTNRAPHIVRLWTLSLLWLGRG